MVSTALRNRYAPEKLDKLLDVKKYCGEAEASHEAGNPDVVSFKAMLKELEGDEPLGNKPVFGGSSLDKIGGFMLVKLLKVVATLTERLEKANKVNEELRRQIAREKVEVRDEAITLAKALEDIESGKDLTKSVNIIGQLLYSESDPLRLGSPITGGSQ